MLHVLHVVEQVSQTIEWGANRYTGNQLKFKTSGKILIVLKDPMEYTLNL